MSTKRTHAKIASKVPLILESYFNDKEKLANAKYIQTLLPWIALDNFRQCKAKDTDWMQIQYWLYYAEALVSLYHTEVPEHRTELAKTVECGIQAIYVAGRYYNASKYTSMIMTAEECNNVQIGLLIGDALKEITDEKVLLAVGRHVQKVLSIPELKQ